MEIAEGNERGTRGEKALAGCERRRGCILYWGINAEAFLI